MAVMKNSQNPMITGSGNMLVSTSGASARKPTAGQSYSKGLMDKMMGENEVSQIDPAQARQQMQARDFKLTPGGEQMGRFNKLAAIRANPEQSGYAQMMAQAGQQTQQPQGMYPGSKAANEHSQGKLAEYAQQGGSGMNIMQREDGKYALTSLGNQRRKSANLLTGGKIEVYENGSMASLGDPSGQTYQIDADTLPSYQAGAARQQKRRQDAKEANGGLSSRDVTKLSKIEQMVASGRTSKPQAAAQLRKMQGRHGLAKNDRVQSVIDRMEGKKAAGSGEQSVAKNSSISKTGEAFKRPLRNPGEYTTAAISLAKQNTDAFASFESLQALGIDSETDFNHDMEAFTSNLDKMSHSDMADWAGMFSEKVAASNGEFLGDDSVANTIAKEIAKHIDAGEFDKASDRAMELSARVQKNKQVKVMKPSDLWEAANEKLMSIPIPASPNTGKL